MSQKNPWKTISSRIVYENPWIRVREDQVIRPDGKSGIYGVVESSIATGAVAINEQQEVYMVGQYRYTMEEYSWEIVEGGSEESESPLDAAKRELKEETGLLAESWTQLGGEIHLTNCHSSERGFVFLAQGLEMTQAAPEGTEVLEVKKIPLSKCLEMIDQGEIKDVVSIIGLQRAAQYVLSSNPSGENFSAKNRSDKNSSNR